MASHNTDHADVVLVVAPERASAAALEPTMIEYFQNHGIRRVILPENNSLSAEIGIIALKQNLQVFVPEDFCDNSVRRPAHGYLGDVATNHLDYPARLLYLRYEHSDFNVAMNVSQPVDTFGQINSVLPLDLVSPDVNNHGTRDITSYPATRPHTPTYASLDEGPALTCLTAKAHAQRVRENSERFIASRGGFKSLTDTTESFDARDF